MEVGPSRLELQNTVYKMTSSKGGRCHRLFMYQESPCRFSDKRIAWLRRWHGNPVDCDAGGGMRDAGDKAGR